MNNISLEITELPTSSSKKVIINEENNIIYEIPAIGNGNPVPKKEVKPQQSLLRPQHFLRPQKLLQPQHFLRPQQGALRPQQGALQPQQSALRPQQGAPPITMGFSRPKTFMSMRFK